MNKKLIALAVGGILASFAPQAQAQVAIAGAFNGWNNTGVPTPGGGPSVYTNIMTGGTPGNINAFKWIANSGSWALTYPASDAKVPYDAGGSNTVYLYATSVGDGWSPIANRVGYEDPGGLTWELAGDFNSWGGGAGWNLNSIGNGVYSNSIVFPTAGNYQCKFRKQGSWDYEFGNNGNNISVVITNSPQTVKVRLDVVKGRYVFGDLLPPPVTNDVVFAVDMTSQTALGNFTPGVDAVYVSGAFNGWPGTGGSALLLTNFPALAGNTNVYYATNRFIGTPGSSATFYKFTCSATAFSGSSGYEPRGDNRTFNLLSTNATGSTPYILPVVSFGDVYATDYLTNDVQVVFTVNMTNAKAGVPPITNNWDPSYPVYLNGDFRDAGWGNPWTPPNLLLMTETSPGSQIFTYTYTVKAGKKNQFSYKYGFDDGVNGYDNEAPSFQDHSRVIRLPSSGTYVLPMDTFGNQYVEPSFGDLSVTKIAGNNVQVKFVGRPGVKLQQASSLGGAWTNNNGTDGNGYSGVTEATPNGTATVTNLPASSAAGFFRLIKQN